MYLDFYNLKEFPFALNCDEKYFFESSGHAEALANMLYTVQQRKGMVLISGEVGSGKTFLANMLGVRLGAGCLTLQIKNPPQSGKQLMKAIASQLGMRVRLGADNLALVTELEEYLLRLQKRGRLVALILDESQDLSSASLEQLRLLWNWEQDGQRLLQIVLTGQPELRERLTEPKWESLRQRIVLSYHLKQLSSEDTGAYIEYRLHVAGNGDTCAEFTPAAKADIYVATGGVPRLINILCDNALLVGYAREQAVIDTAIVSDVLRDMTCWNLPAANTSSSAPE